MANIKRWINREKIPAVNDNSLFKLLIEKQVIKNQDDLLYCQICKREMYFQDIGAIITGNDDIQVVCSRYACINGLNEVDTNG